MGVKAMVVATVRPAHDILFGGVARASGARIAGSLLIDVAVFAAVAAGIVLWGTLTGSPSVPVLLALVGVAFIAGQLSALARHGRTLGRLVLGVRSVHHRTASPVGFGPDLMLLAIAPAPSRFVHARLTLGRDPLDRAFQPVAPEALLSASAVASTEEFATSSRFAPSVAIIRADSRATDFADDLADDGETALAEPRASRQEQSGVLPWMQGPGWAVTPIRRSALLVLDSGEQLTLDTPLLIGRAPAQIPNLPSSTLYAWADLSRTISKTHALIEWSGTAVTVTDLGSTNGTTLAADDDVSDPLLPFHPHRVGNGAQIRIGDRAIHVQLIGDPR
ncbi:FHA domain-containing protein [Leifsonia kafniensis]